MFILLNLIISKQLGSRLIVIYGQDVRVDDKAAEADMCHYWLLESKVQRGRSDLMDWEVRTAQRLVLEQLLRSIYR